MVLLDHKYLQFIIQLFTQIMTKKKTKVDQQQNFQPSRPKASASQPALNKARFPQRTVKKQQYKKKEHQKLLVYNHMKIEDRKAQEEKYKETYIMKKMQEEKKPYVFLHYDDDMNSQLAVIDEDSVQRRNQNETLKKIKDILQANELTQKKHHLCTSAENQYAKVQRLTESLEKQEHKDDSEKQKLCHVTEISGEKEMMLEMQAIFNTVGKENRSQSAVDETVNVIDKINQLQQIYY